MEEEIKVVDGSDTAIDDRARLGVALVVRICSIGWVETSMMALSLKIQVNISRASWPNMGVQRTQTTMVN